MTSTPDLVCVSHLRWNFVYQRPQHLMTRAARTRRVFYVEEPLHEDHIAPHVEAREEGGVTVVVPKLPEGLYGDEAQAVMGDLLRDYFASRGVERPVLWMYTPMQLPMVEDLETSAVVYDCMDELANFRFAPPKLREREQRLFDLADVVFTGGYRLWESKKEQHDNAHAFPSSVEVAHFARARAGLPDPADQQDIPRPRLGFYGVIDERFDIELVSELAAKRPDWQFVLIGPVVKVDPKLLPKGENVHYLGMKKYDELPSYLAHWDVALLPFARNEATEFISPTKTPEYLAAGVPVVSTDIRDVARPWGEAGVVSIAKNAAEFEAAVEAALSERGGARRAKADRMLSQISWDRTWSGMDSLIQEAVDKRDMLKGVMNHADQGVDELVAVADD